MQPYAYKVSSEEFLGCPVVLLRKPAVAYYAPRGASNHFRMWPDLGDGSEVINTKCQALTTVAAVGTTFLQKNRRRQADLPPSN